MDFKILDLLDKIWMISRIYLRLHYRWQAFQDFCRE